MDTTTSLTPAFSLLQRALAAAEPHQALTWARFYVHLSNHDSSIPRIITVSGLRYRITAESGTVWLTEVSDELDAISFSIENLNLTMRNHGNYLFSIGIGEVMRKYTTPAALLRYLAHLVQEHGANNRVHHAEGAAEPQVNQTAAELLMQWLQAHEGHTIHVCGHGIHVRSTLGTNAWLDVGCDLFGIKSGLQFRLDLTANGRVHLNCDGHQQLNTDLHGNTQPELLRDLLRVCVTAWNTVFQHAFRGSKVPRSLQLVPNAQVRVTAAAEPQPKSQESVAVRAEAVVKVLNALPPTVLSVLDYGIGVSTATLNMTSDKSRATRVEGGGAGPGFMFFVTNTTKPAERWRGTSEFVHGYRAVYGDDDTISLYLASTLINQPGRAKPITVLRNTSRMSARTVAVTLVHALRKHITRFHKKPTTDKAST